MTTRDNAYPLQEWDVPTTGCTICTHGWHLDACGTCECVTSYTCGP